jgi:hypothetical protein
VCLCTFNYLVTAIFYGFLVKQSFSVSNILLAKMYRSFFTWNNLKTKFVPVSILHSYFLLLVLKRHPSVFKTRTLLFFSNPKTIQLCSNFIVYEGNHGQLISLIFILVGIRGFSTVLLIGEAILFTVQKNHFFQDNYFYYWACVIS